MTSLYLAVLALLVFSRALGLARGESAESLVVRDYLIISSFAAGGLLLVPDRHAVMFLPMVVPLLGALATTLAPAAYDVIGAVTYNATMVAYVIMWHRVSANPGALIR